MTALTSTWIATSTSVSASTSVYPWSLCGSGGGSATSAYNNIYYHLMDQLGTPITSQTLNEIIRLAKLYTNDNNSIKIKDINAKVIYRANRVRNFNPFINASDKLEEFIRFCGQHGVRKEEMLQLPINLFIGWLILEAAKADQEPEPSIPLLPNLRKHTKPRCKCGRFISLDFVKKQIAFCSPLCFNKYYEKMLIA